MAQTVEDILARRTRALLLNSRIAIEIAPLVAKIMADELGKDGIWQALQIENFNKTAENYLIAD
jgi:glycerol-3-phosphate dehydrogenase